MYRFFCRIPLEQKVPDDTALMKITTKYGEDTIAEINHQLLKSLADQKIIKERKLRVDTTVVEANIAHPTDADLLYEGVKKLEKTVTRIKESCGKKVRGSRYHTRKMKEYLLSIGKILRRRTDEARKEVRDITGKMAIETHKLVTKVEQLARKLIPESQQDRKLMGEALTTIKNVKKIIEQSESVNAVNMHITDRLVSLCGPEARPIVKGKVGKRVEFGYKLQIQEVEGGIITGYHLHKGNPVDKALTDDAIRQHMKVFSKAPKEITLDRGYYAPGNEEKAHSAGIKNVCIPKTGKKSKVRTQFEKSRTFRRLTVAYRNRRPYQLPEATILLKSQYDQRLPKDRCMVRIGDIRPQSQASSQIIAGIRGK